MTWGATTDKRLKRYKVPREITLSNEPVSSRTVDLDGTSYRLRTRWASREPGRWYIDIELQDGTSIVEGFKLAHNQILFRQYVFQDLPAGRLVGVSLTEKEYPEREDLGDDYRLYYLTEQEVNDL